LSTTLFSINPKILQIHSSTNLHLDLNNQLNYSFFFLKYPINHVNPGKKKKLRTNPDNFILFYFLKKKNNEMCNMHTSPISSVFECKARNSNTHITTNQNHSENFNIITHEEKKKKNSPKYSCGCRETEKKKLQNPVIEFRALIYFHTFPSNQTKQTTN